MFSNEEVDRIRRLLTELPEVKLSESVEPVGDDLRQAIENVAQKLLRDPPPDFYSISVEEEAALRYVLRDFLKRQND